MSAQKIKKTIPDDGVNETSNTGEGTRMSNSEGHPEDHLAGDSLSDLENLDDSFDVESLEKKVVMKRNTYGARHHETLETMLQLDLAYRFDGNFEESERILQEVTKIRREDLGDHDRDTLASLTRLAEIKAALGHGDDAEQMQLDVLETRRRVFGEHDLDTINSMEQLAIWYENKGTGLKDESILSKAIKFYQSVVDANSLALGQDDVETIVSKDRLKDAEELRAKTVECSKNALPHTGTD